MLKSFGSINLKSCRRFIITDKVTFSLVYGVRFYSYHTTNFAFKSLTLGSSNITKRLKSTSSVSIPFSLGQPHHQTHPHLLASNELTKGFELKDFKKRLSEFVNLVKPNSISIIPSNNILIMTHDIPFPFRQNSNFFLVTGCLEPNSLLLVEKFHNNSSRSTLFVRPKSEFKEKWDGARTGVEEASRMFHFDETDSIENFSKVFTEKLQSYSSSSTFNKSTSSIPDFLYYDPHCSSDLITQIQDAMTHAHFEFQKVHDIQSIFDTLKCKKTETELKMLRKSCQISAEAFHSAMRCTKADLTEGHIEAIMEFECRLRGGQRLAYPPVVASGIAGNSMHYIYNNQILKSGDLLLVDAGCEYHLYPSDITRTWPVDGKFNEPQRLIYEAVLRVQKECIRHYIPGASLQKLQDFSVKRLTEEMVFIGLCKKEDANLVIQMIYPHNIGHPAGIDIHEDEPFYDTPFEENMVVTCEPGIYVPSEAQFSLTSQGYQLRKMIKEKFWGINVRIEDDIVVRKDTVLGPEVLTRQTIKEVEDIEKLMENNGHRVDAAFDEHLLKEHVFRNQAV